MLGVFRDGPARLDELVALRLPVAQQGGPTLRLPVMVLVALLGVLGLDAAPIGFAAVLGLLLFAGEGGLDGQQFLGLVVLLGGFAF